MKNLLLIILFFSLVNCNRYIPSAQRKQLKEIFISDFKMLYFKQLLKSAYHNSQPIRTILNDDASSYPEPLWSLEDIRLIDSLVMLDNIKLVQDSIHNLQKSESAQGKAVFEYALNKYNSKWLDSLAQNRYTFFRRSQKNFHKQLRN